MHKAKHKCPFCGAEPKTTRGQGGKWWVYCPEEQTCPVYIEQGGTFDTELLALQAWDEAIEKVLGSSVDLKRLQLENEKLREVAEAALHRAAIEATDNVFLGMTDDAGAYDAQCFGYHDEARRWVPNKLVQDLNAANSELLQRVKQLEEFKDRVENCDPCLHDRLEAAIGAEVLAGAGG